MNAINVKYTQTIIVTANIYEKEKTVTAYDLNPTEADQFRKLIHPRELGHFLQDQFRKSFCKGLLGLKPSERREADLVKKSIIDSFCAGDPDFNNFKFSNEFNKEFLWMAESLEDCGIIETYYNIKGDYLVELTNVGHTILNLLFVEEKVNPDLELTSFDAKNFLKDIPLKQALDIEIYNVLSDSSWNKIRKESFKNGKSPAAMLRSKVAKRVLPLLNRGLLKYPNSNFNNGYSTAIHRMSTVLCVYHRNEKFSESLLYRLTPEANEIIDRHLGFDKINKYNEAVQIILKIIRKKEN